MAWLPEDEEQRRWTAIVIGLVLGLLAKYAIRIQDRVPIRWGRELLVDALLLGVNALFCSITISRLGWTGQEAIAIAALFGATSDRVFRLVRTAFEKRAQAAVDAAAAATMFADSDHPQVVPPSTSPVRVKVVATDDPRTAGVTALRDIIPEAPADPAMEGDLSRLDEIE